MWPRHSSGGAPLPICPAFLRAVIRGGLKHRSIGHGHCDLAVSCSRRRWKHRGVASTAGKPSRLPGSLARSPPVGRDRIVVVSSKRKPDSRDECHGRRIDADETRAACLKQGMSLPDTRDYSTTSRSLSHGKERGSARRVDRLSRWYGHSLLRAHAAHLAVIRVRHTDRVETGSQAHCVEWSIS
jgi:hypothetical protein